MAASQMPEHDERTRKPLVWLHGEVKTPPFTVEGTIYLPYEAELRIALEAYGDRFVAVTDAKYWAYGVAESPHSVELLAVNHARAHISIAAGVQWRGESGPPHADSDGGRNPW